MKISQEQAAFLEVCEQNAELIMQAIRIVASDLEVATDDLPESDRWVFSDGIAGWRRLEDKISTAYNNLPVEE